MPDIRICPELKPQLSDFTVFMQGKFPAAVFHKSGRLIVQESSLRFDELAKEGKVYGTNTGFGPFVEKSRKGGECTALELVDHLLVGYGEEAPESIKKLAMLLRIIQLSRGFSGIQPEVLEQYIFLYNSRWTPSVPRMGSLGASGDLVPLAWLAAPVFARGVVLRQDEQICGSEWHRISFSGLKTKVRPKDSLSLCNGTSYSLAAGILALLRYERSFQSYLAACASMLATLGVRTDFLNPGLHDLKSHSFQKRVAERLLHMMTELNPSSERDILQESYSIRCIPQVLDGCLRDFEFARNYLQDELNSISDNPLIYPDRNALLHGGNFFGQAVSMACDSLNRSSAFLSLLVERQIAFMLDPGRNGLGCLMLSTDESSSSGLAGLQLTATALVAEMRIKAQCYSLTSVPTNNNNQDIVPMSGLASYECFYQTKRLEDMVSYFILTVVQLAHLSGKTALLNPELRKIPVAQSAYNFSNTLKKIRRFMGTSGENNLDILRQK